MINTLHVLLVEDNKLALHFIQSIAQQAGLSYTSALDGESALQLAQTETFDLVITDIGLPGISGYELANTIRHWEKIQGKTPVPIIGLTALDLEEAKPKCHESGMNTVLKKPIQLETIHEIIAQYLQIQNNAHQ